MIARKLTQRATRCAAGVLIAAGVCGVVLAGCASSEGPEVIVLDAGTYHEAFDAAVETARRHRMPAEMKDRRRGVIETEAAHAGSLLEPWRTDNASFVQTLDNTFAHQRRRTRFEFIPAGFRPPAVPDDEDLPGPDVFAEDAPTMDLTQVDGELELRVWVYLERAYTPGLRRDTWSRRLTTRSRIHPTDPEASPLPGRHWTPVARDKAYEKRLLGRIARILDAQDALADVDPEPALDR